MSRAVWRIGDQVFVLRDGERIEWLSAFFEDEPAKQIELRRDWRGRDHQVTRLEIETHPHAVVIETSARRFSEQYDDEKERDAEFDRLAAEIAAEYDREAAVPVSG